MCSRLFIAVVIGLAATILAFLLRDRAKETLAHWELAREGREGEQTYAMALTFNSASVVATYTLVLGYLVLASTLCTCSAWLWEWKGRPILVKEKAANVTRKPT